jgi:hypothetical protein
MWGQVEPKATVHHAGTIDEQEEHLTRGWNPCIALANIKQHYS